MKRIMLGKDPLGLNFESKDVPIGAILEYAGTDAPVGYLKCDGSTVTATDYPELVTVLGSTTLPSKSGKIIKAAHVSTLVG